MKVSGYILVSKCGRCCHLISREEELDTTDFNCIPKTELCNGILCWCVKGSPQVEETIFKYRKNTRMAGKLIAEFWEAA
jgi:hypothetical protein